MSVKADIPVTIPIASGSVVRPRRRRLDDPSFRPIVEELIAAAQEVAEADEKQAAAHERRRLAVLRAREEAGATWDEIALLIGVPDRRTAEALVRQTERRARAGNRPAS